MSVNPGYLHIAAPKAPNGTYRIAGKFRLEKIFTFFAPCSHGRNFYPANFLSRVNDYIEPMVIFTAWVKFYFAKYFCNARVAELGEIFVQRIFSAARY